MWQMQMTPFSDTDMVIATSIIDSIDESGFLATSVDDIYDSLKDELEKSLKGASPDAMRNALAALKKASNR